MTDNPAIRNARLRSVIARLLRYSLDPVDWEYTQLTDTEQAIVGNADTLAAIRDLADGWLS